MTGGFSIAHEDLPAALPVFPLARVILLPRVEMPLNIFEPRYLAMTRAALAGGRLVGMVQGRGENGALAPVGCAGRIVSFSETEDGRYMITLKGVCRFSVEEELARDAGGFRVVRPGWRAFRHDFDDEEDGGAVCRESLMSVLRGYFDKMNMFCDKWEEMRHIPCERLISTLCVVCPFSAGEKQALLEAPDLAARARLLQGILEHAVEDLKETSTRCH